jgi:hypothetical protein
MRKYNLLFLLVILGACQPLKVSPTHPIIGTWQWISTTGGFSGRASSTPQTTGYTQSLELTKKGKYRKFRANQLVEEKRYGVANELTIFKTEPLEVVRFRNKMQNQVILYLKNDSLVLSDNHYDGYSHLYVRKKD